MSVRRFVVLAAGMLAIGTLSARGQGAGWLEKSWTLVRARSSTGDSVVRAYLTGLRFDKDNIYISTSPDLNHPITQPYTVTGYDVKTQFISYKITAISDSTLVLLAPNNIVLYFIAEGYSPCGDSIVLKAGEFNGRPYYKAMPYLTPKKSGESLFHDVEEKVDLDRLKSKISVSFSFIVDENGKVQDAKILQSNSPAIEAIIRDQLQKSSGKWRVPAACGVPVATLLSQTFVFNPPGHF